MSELEAPVEAFRFDAHEVQTYLRLENNAAELQLLLRLWKASRAYILSLCRELEAGEEPLELQQAMMVLTSHFYDNRALVNHQAMRSFEIPYCVSDLIASYREQTP
jgi:hypothetical protein